MSNMVSIDAAYLLIKSLYILYILGKNWRKCLSEKIKWNYYEFTYTQGVKYFFNLLGVDRATHPFKYRKFDTNGESLASKVEPHE